MKLPYGQSNFRTVAAEFYYVNRTMYIEKLEQQANIYLFYLRPRKFGKSLVVSMLVTTAFSTRKSLSAFLANITLAKRAGFGESHLKVVFAALPTPPQAHLVRSEPEAAQRYMDLLCTGMPRVRICWNVAFELKYPKKLEAKPVAAKAEEARTQL